jgi:hypothetical protein
MSLPGSVPSALPASSQTPPPWKPHTETALDRFSLRCIGRRVSHLTPRYALDLTRVRAFEILHPDAPWLTQAAVGALEAMLQPRDRGLEYGSGRSTTWLVRRTAHLVSVETDKAWYARVRSRLRDAGLFDRVDYRLVPADDRAGCLAVAEALQTSSLDYVLVDGAWRDAVALRATELLKPGGLLIVDNANWFLPATRRSRAPLSVSELPTTPDWALFAQRVRDWRVIWTSNGVCDTAIWVRSS